MLSTISKSNSPLLLTRLIFYPQEIIGGIIGGIIGPKRAPGHGFPSFNLFWFFLAFSFSLSVHAGIPVQISVVHFGADILPKPPNPPKPPKPPNPPNPPKPPNLPKVAKPIGPWPRFQIESRIKGIAKYNTF